MSPRQLIVVVEDEADILEIVSYNLLKKGYRVIGAACGRQAWQLIRGKRPDLVLLDLMIPELDGLQLCRLMKNHSHTRRIPIIMLTAKGEEADIVRGLESGADDYITKPFSPRVLIARVEAVLRRREQPATGEAPLTIHGLSIHPGRHEVLFEDREVRLTLTEFRILHLLARRPGWVFTRQQIIDAVHGDDYAVTDRSIDFQIVGLRKKLGAAGDFIQTVRGVGYRFKGAG